MFAFKITQTLGALLVLAGFFLPWSSVNFGATMSRAAAVVNKVVPGGLGNLRNLGDPAVAAGAAANVVANAAEVATSAGRMLNVPKGAFSGLDLTLSSKLLYVNFLVPLAALLLLLTAWLTALGTGKLGVLFSCVCLAVLLGTIIMSFMGGVMSEVQTGLQSGGTMVPKTPSGVRESIGLMLGYLLWGFWLTAGGALLMLACSPFAKKPIPA